MKSAETIHTLLPHRGRMKLIEEIIAAGDDFAVTAATVTDEWPLVQPNGVSPVVLIELMAQTASIAIGWKKLQNEEPLHVKGWLVGVKNASFKVTSIPLQTRVITQAQVQAKLDNYTIIGGESKINDVTAASIAVQVLQALDDQ